MSRIQAVITITAASAGAEDVDVSVQFDPPADRRQPTVVHQVAAAALDAIFAAAKESSVADVQTVKGDAKPGVKHAAG
jgi:hypothetical protein